MLLWIFFALLTAVAFGAIMHPFTRQNPVHRAREQFDATVYKDQLTEIETDCTRGLINSDEAKVAKVEIARRLLATSNNKTDQSTNQKNQGRTAVPLPVFVLCVLCVPFLSLILYLSYGSPGQPNQPFVARQNAPLENQPLRVLMSKMQAHLQANPNDGKGWDLVAPIYLKLRQFAQAALAYKKALELQGETLERSINYAESLYWSTNQNITPLVEQALINALKLKTDIHMFRVRLAQGYEQQGRIVKALKEWDKLSKYAQDNPQILKLVQENKSRLQALAAKAKQGDRPNVLAGPSAQDIEAASQLSENERTAMINAMVEGLSERLRQNGGNLQEWVRLVQAYKVLGKRDAAYQAIKDAKKNLQDNQDSVSALEALEKDLQ
ncbi:MAG: c-type cytochrome biogenesis protein CcmI [Pseudomonadota bacterium]